MGEDTLAHLFEPFVRGSAVSRVEGSGLGLSIVKGLVELMEGKICVRSKPGEGTSFQIELKVKAASADVGQTECGQSLLAPVNATLFSGATIPCGRGQWNQRRDY